MLAWSTSSRRLACLLLSASLTVLVACGDKQPLTPEDDAIASIDVVPSAVTLTALGNSRAFGAVAKDGAGRTLYGVEFTWISSSTEVATIDEAGVATARSGGKTEIKASARGVSGVATLTVMQAVADVEVSPASATLGALGSAYAFGAVARDANGFEILGTSFSWSSSDESVATVDAEGVVTAVGNGQVSISASAGGVSDSVTLSVSQVTASVQVDLSALTMKALGETYQLSATARDENGNDISGAPITWGSSDIAVATVTGAGLVTAVGGGTAWIVAATGGVADTVSVTVSQAVASVRVVPSTASFDAVGQTTGFAATAFDALDHAIADASITWSSSDGAVVVVDGTGLATAMGPGSAEIVAASEEVADTADVTVIVQDSLVFSLEAYIGDDIAPTEASLGSFTIPPHIAERGVTVYVEILLSGTLQNDESFALGMVGSDGITFIGDPNCPVIPDDPALGRGWVLVGQTDIPEGTHEFVARHAIEFSCYTSDFNFATENSVHFEGIKFIYWVGN